MKAIIESHDLAGMTAHAARILDQDHPFLRLQAEEGRLRIQAADQYGRWSHAWAAADVGEPESLTVNGLWLNSLARAMPDGDVRVERDDRDRLVLRSRDTTLRMNVGAVDTPVDAYPLPENRTPVDPDAFARTVGSVAWLPAGGVRDPNMPILGAVLVTVEDGRMTMQSTNRYVACRRSMTVDGLPDGRWLVDGAWLDANRLGVGEIAVSERTFETVTSDWEDAVTLMDGEFPRVDRLWFDAGDASAHVTVDRQSLLRAAVMLKSVNFDVKADVVPLRLDAVDGRLRVSFTGTAADSESNGVRMVDAAIDGVFSVSVNAAYLIGVLKALDDDRVVLDVRDARRTFIIRQESDDCRMVVAPIQPR